MKKHVSFIAVLLCILTLISCTSDTPSSTNSDSAADADDTNAIAVGGQTDTAESADAESESDPAQTEQSQQEYKEYLVSIGFPADYTELLAPLHEAHPDWQFNPIMITELSNGKYTWKYIIDKEVEDDENNTVYYTLSDAMDYAIDDKLVESGIWFRAKRESVEFFMDPRNFLYEDKIFMFENLTGKVDYNVAAVESLLQGTFMFRKEMGDEGSDMKYAECFLQVGKELGISPLVIAARLRQEQGVEGKSPLISGTCGDTMWQYYTEGTNNAPSGGYTEAQLKAYNGYYNFFNINATGNGYFNVFLSGMKEAQEGGWTSRYLAVKGGATKLKSRYIDDYQQTLYFQKYNVDPRSGRNFWGQYMQAIHAAYDEGRSTYKAYERVKMLDSPFVFDIPVFSGMPTSPCPDPGTRYS